MRYLRLLIYVTKSCKPCVFKKDRKVEENYLFFFLHRSRYNLSPYCDSTSCIRLFSALLLLNGFRPARLCHLTFVTLTHTVWRSRALYTWFLPFVTSSSAVYICHALAEVIFVYVTMIFITLIHAISFCWVSICYVSFSMIWDVLCLF